MTYLCPSRYNTSPAVLYISLPFSIPTIIIARNVTLSYNIASRKNIKIWNFYFSNEFLQITITLLRKDLNEDLSFFIKFIYILSSY